MHVGLVIYGSLDTLSGGYLYDRMLVDYLRRSGDQVSIIAIPWRSYPLHLSDNLSRRLRTRLAGLDVDILLQDELNHPSLAGINRNLKRDASFPIVSIVHHLRCDEQHSIVAGHVYRTIESFYVNSVDGFIYNSLSTRRAVQGLLKESIPGVVAYPAADHLPIPTGAQVDNLIDERRRRCTPLHILFVGNVIPRKGLHTLLSALKRVERVEWVLHVVGALDADPRYSSRMYRQCRTSGLAHNVCFHGRLSEDALLALLRSCHLLALPSYEGFGIVYVEAMAYGLPVIASTAGAAYELVNDGCEGYLVPPDDPEALAQALRRYSSTPDVIDTMGRAARARFDAHPQWTESMAAARTWLHETFM